MGGLKDGVIALDREWRYTYVNATAEHRIGRTREQLLGQTLWDVFPEARGTEFEQACLRALTEGTEERIEEYCAPLNRWFENTVYPLGDRIAIHARDITEAKRAEVALRESEERLRRYFELGLIGAAITSPDKGILEVNDKLCRILGFPSAELLQKTWAELTHPDDLPADIAAFNRVVAGEIDGYSLDKRWIRKDGRAIDSTISVKCIRRPDGSVDYFVALLQDVSEQRRAEEERERFALLVENSSEFIAICDMNLVPVFINDAGLQMVGLDSLQAAKDKPVSELFFAEDIPALRDTILPRVLREGKGQFEIRVRHAKTGETLWMIDSLLVLRDLRGCPSALAIIGVDITERKRAEAELRDARDHLEARVVDRTKELSAAKNELAADLAAMNCLNQLTSRLLIADALEPLLYEILHGVMELQNADFGIVRLHDANTKALNIVAQHGFTQDILDYFQAVEDESCACGRDLKQWQRVVISDVNTDPRFAAHRDVAFRAGFGAVQSTPLFTLGGDALGLISTHFRGTHTPPERELRLTDIYARQASQMIERHLVEAALRRSEAYLAMGQRLSHTGSGSWNVSTDDIFWTEESYRIHGFEPGRVKPSGELFFDTIVHPDDRAFVRQASARVVAERTGYDLNFRIVRPDRTTRYIHSVGEPVFNESGALVEVIGAVIDVTDRKLGEDALYEAQTELAQIARAITIGELAASIAHEANQPITAIVSNGHACLNWIDRPDPNWSEARVAVQRMIRDGRRASEVISNVRSLMKRVPVRVSKLDINGVVDEVVRLIAREVDSRAISVRTELSQALPRVTGDRIHLQQVLVNLLMNAMDATAAAAPERRVIVVTTQQRGADEIIVGIRDSGVGIAAENVEHVFQPFFSDKPDGLGMGLWISRSIVQAHRGRLWAERNEASGATFHFTLPVATPDSGS